MDRKYEKAKADNIAEWENSSRDKTSEAVLKRLAQVQQVKSEAASGDERAITEVMPWTKYIRGDGNGAREPPKPPMPAPPTNGAPKPKTEDTGIFDRYEKTKKEFLKGWEKVRMAQLNSGAPFKKPAQNHQFKFENAIHDPRTKTETMPWTKYLKEGLRWLSRSPLRRQQTTERQRRR